MRSISRPAGVTRTPPAQGSPRRRCEDTVAVRKPEPETGFGPHSVNLLILMKFNILNQCSEC